MRQQKGLGPSLCTSLLDFSREKALVDAARHLSQSIRVFDESTNGKTPPTLRRKRKQRTSHQDHFRGCQLYLPARLLTCPDQRPNGWQKKWAPKSTPSTVSKSTSLVVAGDKGGKKRRQAEEFGVRLIDAEEFLRMVEEFRQQKNIEV